MIPKINNILPTVSIVQIKKNHNNPLTKKILFLILKIKKAFVIISIVF